MLSTACWMTSSICRPMPRKDLRARDVRQAAVRPAGKKRVAGYRLNVADNQTVTDLVPAVVIQVPRALAGDRRFPAQVPQEQAADHVRWGLADKPVPVPRWGAHQANVATSTAKTQVVLGSIRWTRNLRSRKTRQQQGTLPAGTQTPSQKTIEEPGAGTLMAENFRRIRLIQTNRATVRQAMTTNRRDRSRGPMISPESVSEV